MGAALRVQVRMPRCAGGSVSERKGFQGAREGSIDGERDSEWRPPRPGQVPWREWNPDLLAHPSVDAQPLSRGASRGGAAHRGWDVGCSTVGHWEKNPSTPTGLVFSERTGSPARITRACEGQGCSRHWALEAGEGGERSMNMQLRRKGIRVCACALPCLPGAFLVSDAP